MRVQSSVSGKNINSLKFKLFFLYKIHFVIISKYIKIVNFRKENLMRVVNLAGVEAVLGKKYSS